MQTNQEGQHLQGGKGKAEPASPVMSRRKALAAIGMAGAAMAAGKLFGGTASAQSVTEAVYGAEESGDRGTCGCGETLLTDFGADGTQAADTAAIAALAEYVNGYPNGSQPFGIVDGIPVRVGISCVSDPMKYTITTGVHITRPVELAGSVSKVLDYTGTGTMLRLGPDDGRNSANFFSEDLYILDGIHFTGGKQMTAGVSFSPFIGMLARIKNCVFSQFGNPSSWAVEFLAQNWWPEISGCRWSSYDDQAKYFVKAIDDGRSGQYRGSGNSRLNFVDNKCKWLGYQIGGIGVYTNAAKALISRSDFEGAAAGVQLGYPSLKAQVESCYFEQPFGGASIRLGDDDIRPNNWINHVSIRDIYANLHTSGKFLDTANPNVSANMLMLEGVTLIAGGEQTPVLHMNDLPGQTVRASGICASYQPLLPVTSNPIKVVDVDGVLNRSVVNGALAVSQRGDQFTVSAGALVPLADQWFAKTDFTNCAASRVKLGHADYLRTRYSPYALRFTPGGTGTYKSVYFMVPGLIKLAGHVSTLQVFARASVSAGLRIVSKAAYTSQAITTVEIKPENVTLSPQFQEFTIPFWIPDNPDLTEDSWFMLELVMPDSPGWYEFTGVRINHGDFGLCHANDYMCEGETLAAVQRYFERRSFDYRGDGMKKMTVAMAPKAKGLDSAVMTFATPSRSPLAGVEVKGGASFEWGGNYKNIQAVADFDTRAFYF